MKRRHPPWRRLTAPGPTPAAAVPAGDRRSQGGPEPAGLPSEVSDSCVTTAQKARAASTAAAANAIHIAPQRSPSCGPGPGRGGRAGAQADRSGPEDSLATEEPDLHRGREQQPYGSAEYKA